MHIYAFIDGHPLHQYGSHGAQLSRVLKGVQPVTCVCIQLEAGGVLGRHPAAADQLLMVVAGRGTVSGGDGIPRPIEAGQAALWLRGESHETASATGLTAIVIEGEGLHENLALYDDEGSA